MQPNWSEYVVIKKNVTIEKTVLFHGALQWEAIPRATPKNWLPCHFTLLQLRAIPPAKIGLSHFCGQNWHGKWPLPLLPHQISPSICNYQIKNNKFLKLKKKIRLFRKQWRTPSIYLSTFD